MHPRKDNADAIAKLSPFDWESLLFLLQIDVFGQFHDQDSEADNCEAPYVLHDIIEAERINGDLVDLGE